MCGRKRAQRWWCRLRPLSQPFYRTASRCLDDMLRTTSEYSIQCTSCNRVKPLCLRSLHDQHAAWRPELWHAETHPRCVRQALRLPQLTMPATRALLITSVCSMFTCPTLQPPLERHAFACGRSGPTCERSSSKPTRRADRTPLTRESSRIFPHDTRTLLSNSVYRSCTCPSCRQRSNPLRLQ